MLLDALVALFVVVKSQLIQVLGLNEMRQSITRMHIFVDLHEDLLRRGYNSANETVTTFSVLLILIFAHNLACVGI